MKYGTVTDMATITPLQELLRQRDADDARTDALDALAATVAPIVERDPKRVLLDTAASAPLTKCVHQVPHATKWHGGQ